MTASAPKLDLLIFDLDGTLIDSKLDLAYSVNATRAHMGMGPLPHEVIASYVGNGAPVLMRRALGPDAREEDVARSIEYFIHYYSEHCLENTALYPYVRESLDRFRDAGVKLAVLTNKPVRISGHILNGLGVSEHFFQVYGGNSFPEKKPDPVGIEALLRETGIDRKRTAMVGDSAVDIRTARNADVLACGVSYGFQPEGFAEHPPDLLVDDMRELGQYVFDGRDDQREAE